MPSIGFDESDQFFYFGSSFGIKIIDIINKEELMMVGNNEINERFI
jgi:hypothetical protein